MNTIRQLLQTKGNDLWSARPDTSVYDALQLMDEHSIGALLVLTGMICWYFFRKGLRQEGGFEGKNFPGYECGRNHEPPGVLCSH